MIVLFFKILFMISLCCNLFNMPFIFLYLLLEPDDPFIIFITKQIHFVINLVNFFIFAVNNCNVLDSGSFQFFLKFSIFLLHFDNDSLQVVDVLRISVFLNLLSQFCDSCVFVNNRIQGCFFDLVQITTQFIVIFPELFCFLEHPLDFLRFVMVESHQSNDLIFFIS